MDGQGDHLQSRAALRGTSLRRKAARVTIINGAFLVALNTLGLARGFLLAGFLATDDYGVWGVLSVAVAGLFWFKDVGVPDKYVQQDEVHQELAFQKAVTVEGAGASVTKGVEGGGGCVFFSPLFASGGGPGWPGGVRGIGRSWRRRW